MNSVELFLRRHSFSILFWALFLILGLGSLGLMLDARSDCSEKGGQLVRGVFWYECVGGVHD